MKRLLAAAYAIYVLNLLVVGPTRTRVFVVLTLALLLSAAAFAVFCQAHPEHPLGQWFLRSRGPRTDTPYMTRAELLSSSRFFLLWGMLLFAVHVAMLAIRQIRVEDSLSLMCVMAFFMFSGLTLVIGGLYLGVRGLLRPASYEPPHYPEYPPREGPGGTA